MPRSRQKELEWVKANPERVAAYKQKHHWRLRKEVLLAYAPDGIIECCRCAFNDIRALQLDHINGGGSKQVKELKGRGWVLYRWLKEHNFPPGYQILCANCNWIKRHENKEWGKNVTEAVRRRSNCLQTEVA